MNSKKKTIIQCDFDGTVTIGDVGFLLLDAFAEDNWRESLEKYRNGKITVGRFNKLAFALVNATREEMESYIRKKIEIRSGFTELVEICRSKQIKFAIVSNGLDFYIKTALASLGINDVPVHAATTVFDGHGVQVDYISPAGKILDEGFKESHAQAFLDSGYRIIYIGNGYSDFAAAKMADKIYAIDSLARHCTRENVMCTRFDTLHEVAEEIALL